MSALQEYEIEVKNKKGFFASLFRKFKRNNKQKLLGPGGHNNDLMWRLAEYKYNFFDKIDSLSRKRKRIRKANEIIIEVIGKNSVKNEVLIAGKKLEKIIIPKNVGARKKEN